MFLSCLRSWRTSEVLLEPSCCAVCHPLHGSRFWKEVARPRNNLHCLRLSKPPKCLSIEFDHRKVVAADQEEGWGFDPIECVAGEIGTPAARYDGSDSGVKPCCCHERSRRSCACAEQTNLKPGHGRVLIQPAQRIDQPAGQQLNIEDIRTVLFFIKGQKVKQQRGEPLMIEGGGNGRIARTRSTRSGSMGEDNQGAAALGNVQC